MKATNTDGRPLLIRFAEKYGIESDKLISILKATAFSGRFRDKDGKDREITTAEMAALLSVCERYDLNPFVREIWAIPAKGTETVLPVVSVDGWCRIVNQHPQYDGCEFHYAEKGVHLDAENRDVPEYIECVMYRKDRRVPFTHREYIVELYRAPEKKSKDGRDYVKGTAWNTNTMRMYQHRTFVQAARKALGYTGIFDEDEAKRVMEAVESAAPAGKPVVAMPEALDAAVEPSADPIPELSSTLNSEESQA